LVGRKKATIKEYGYKTAGLELFRGLVQQMTNEQISYGMKHFLGNMDVESISKGEHPDFSGLGKIGMIIRGIMNKTVAEGLKYTSGKNQWLVEHYYNYPKDPSGFEEWNKSLHKTLDESFVNRIISKLDLKLNIVGIKLSLLVRIILS